MTRVPDLKMLQINTDGLTVRIPIKYKKLYWEICKEWEARTRLVLEYVAYQKMIILNVNNYIAVGVNGKVKYKGTFKSNQEMIKDGEYHKSFSQGIVALAVSDYFLKNIPVEQTVRNHTNIYDFCKTFNASHGWVSETLDIKEGVGKNHRPEQKTNRYFISTNGRTFRKLKDDRSIEIESGKLVTIFNTFVPKDISDYDINYDYYIDECYKIIHKIDGTLERLENISRLERERIKLEKEEANYVKYCVDKLPTQRQYDMYKRDWLTTKYGIPTIKTK